MADVPPLTVSALAGAIDGVLRESFPYVAVVGEVGRTTLHGNGHFYFDLKDEMAVISAVMWRDAVAATGVLPKMGDSVVAHARVTTYKARGTYQLQVMRFEPVGIGTLLQQIEVLKAKLLAEGLFDTARKRVLPMLPRKVGVITSPTGAVIHDMMVRMRARCPAHVVVWPATVQGGTAAGELVAALEGFNVLPDDQKPDVVIVARGGGSVEDLMPFNDEKVVRALAASGIPTVSAVGHEPDVTLCDFAADVRAATPTAAIELVMPVRDDLLSHLAGTQAWLGRVIRDTMGTVGERLVFFTRRLGEPVRLVEQARLRMDDVSLRLQRVGPEMMRRPHERVAGLARVLASMRPLAPLERGFAVVRGVDGGVVRSKDAPAGPVLIQFNDGERKGELS